MPNDCKASLESGWSPTHTHRKGGRYRLLARGRLESDLSAVVVYDDEDGNIWVRPQIEFDDGRFTPVSKATRMEAEF